MNMEKMDLKSMDIVEENFKKIEELFPEAIVETKIRMELNSKN